MPDLGLLNTHCPNLLEIRQSHQYFLHPVHFQGAHAAGHALGEYLGDAGAVLDEFFDGFAGNQQLVQVDAAFVAGFVAFVTAFGAVQAEFAVATVGLYPAFVELLLIAFGIGFPLYGLAQLVRVFGDEGFDLG